MKLSKLQQAVVDKMREGYVLKYFGPLEKDGNTLFKPRPTGATFRALLKKGIIELIPNLIPKRYRLTEQYKNLQAMEGQTS